MDNHTEPGLTTAESLDADLVQTYRRDGCVKVRKIISRDEAQQFARAALERSKTQKGAWLDNTFEQFVNVWRDDPVMRRLTLHPNVSAIAQKLAGIPLRLLHDHILIKSPHNGKATWFHQDLAYTPIQTSDRAILCWVALTDVPPERGCLTYIPGPAGWDELVSANFTDRESFFQARPSLRFAPRITFPLEAGDCTFHDGRTPHMAAANATDEPRIGHSIIFVHEAATYRRIHHPITKPLDLTEGRPLDHEMFPTTTDILAGRV